MTSYQYDFYQAHYGLCWVYKNTRGDTLEIACNNLSENFKYGVFEIRPSWKKVTNTVYNMYDPVIYKDQTFQDVTKWINELDKRDDEK